MIMTHNLGTQFITCSTNQYSHILQSYRIIHKFRIYCTYHKYLSLGKSHHHCSTARTQLNHQLNPQIPKMSASFCNTSNLVCSMASVHKPFRRDTESYVSIKNWGGEKKEYSRFTNKQTAGTWNSTKKARGMETKEHDIDSFFNKH